MKPEELLPILVPSDTVDWLDTCILAIEDRMFTVDSILRNLDTGDGNRGVCRGRVQCYKDYILSGFSKRTSVFWHDVKR